MLKYLPLLALVLTAVGCTSGKTRKPSDVGPQQKIVLFAPMETGPLAAIDPEAKARFPRDLVNYINTMVDFATGSYSEALPAAADPAWDAGPVGAMSGAHVAVLVSVDAIQDEPLVTAPFVAKVATVTMRAFDVKGAEFWRKTTQGSVPNERSPKLAGPGNAPESRAAWAAARKGVVSLCNYLNGASDTRFLPSGDKDLGDAPLVDVTIDSIPANADIIIDGHYRGTTPYTIALPVLEIELIIRRQGYQPWSMTFTPEVNMPIKPALEPLPGAAQ